MDRIPILHVGNFLLVTIQVELHDQLAERLQIDIGAQITKTNARGVLIEISSLQTIDSYMARILGQIARIAKILDAETVLVGMQPIVAITMVEMGVSLAGIRTALSAERGMALLQDAVEDELFDAGEE